MPPTNETAVAGSTVTFNATVTGSEPMSYSWQFNGTNLTGAQSETLTLTNVQTEQSGTYVLVASNAAGSTASAPANLEVVVPPAITAQPSNELALIGSSVQLSVTASGTQPLTYQWQFNGTNLDGARGVTLTIDNVQASQAGSYSVAVSNDGGSTNSTAAMLTVVKRPNLVPHPPTNNGLFTFTLQGDAGMNYEIQSTTNYQQWNALGILSNITGQADFTDLTSSNGGFRFYRARLSY
jgi:hypothetical protein